VPRPGQLADLALLDRVDRRAANSNFGMVDHQGANSKTYPQ